MNSVAVQGLDELVGVLRALEKATSGDRLGDTLQEPGRLLLEGVRARVAVDTGKLRDSYEVQIVTDGDQAELVVETDSDHAEAQEFGTRHQPGTPHLRPTIDEDGDRLTDALADALVAAVEGAVR